MERYKRQRSMSGMYIYILGSILIGFGGGLLVAASLPYPALVGLGLLVIGGLLLAIAAPLWKPQ